MVAKAKRNQANTHDKRHENGLAAPIGKRIPKQKSNSNLHANGHATPPPASNLLVDGQPHTSSHYQQQQQQQQHVHHSSQNLSSAPPPPPPQQQQQQQHNSHAAHAANSQLATPSVPTDSAAMPNVAVTSALEERARAGSDVSLDGLEACRPCDDSAPTSGSLLRSSAPGNKTPPAYMPNMLTVATTILSSCPLRDVLAILIILLQLPPTVLTVVQFLFATLTFVPPQAGTPLSALSAFPSFTDIFQGSGGTPSLFTIVFADALILLLWLVLWVPVQNFFLDLAQAFIAIALGGAAAGKNGATNSVFICFFIILSNHLFRFRPLRQHLLQILYTGLARGGLEFLSSPPSVPTYLESFSTPHGWPRSLLGIHILAQGVVRIIRRSLSRRDTVQSLPTGKKTDPEAGVHPQRSSTAPADSSSEVPNFSSTDGRPPGPSPATNTHKDKASSSRRKRKQATHVRSQQPFWAALASTKVTVLKEMESSRAANDAGEANAKDANHIGNAVFRSEDDRVWISEVGHADISFRVCLFGASDCEGVQEQEEEGVGSGIDKSKPFYIRVNGADWSSTRIRRTVPDGYVGEEGTGSWVGEIFGLTGLSNYYCEFVRTKDREVFYSASLITSPSPVAELASVASPPAHQTLRPSSPTTTLKNSIAAADQQLQDHRNRLKRNKKDHKAAVTAIKKEVDTLGTRLGNAGGNDERQRQRALQFTQNIRQAEDTTADIALKIDALGEIPEDEVTKASAIKQEWQKERNNKEAASSEFDNFKADMERQARAIESDISTALQKRERLQQRLARLNEQYDRLITANEEGYTAKQRKEQERVALENDRFRVEGQYRSNIENFEHRANDYHLSTTQMVHQIQQLEAILLQQQQQPTSVPATPDGPHPGMNNMSPYANPFQSFTFPSFGNQVNSTPGSIRGGRGRSSSMLSNVSGFTDGFDEMASPSMHVMHNPFHGTGLLNGRQGSHGSGSLSSGTSSQSSSQRDPMSPVPNSKPMFRSPNGGNAGLASPMSGGR